MQERKDRLGVARRMEVQCIFRGKGKDGDGRVGNRGVKAVARGKLSWVWQGGWSAMPFKRKG